MSKKTPARAAIITGRAINGIPNLKVMVVVCFFFKLLISFINQVRGLFTLTVTKGLVTSSSSAALATSLRPPVTWPDW